METFNDGGIDWHPTVLRSTLGDQVTRKKETEGLSLLFAPLPKRKHMKIQQFAGIA